MSAIPVDSVDLFDQGYARDPYPAMAALRENEPVKFDENTGLWLISRYQDVRSILLDPENFLPDNAIDAIGRFSVPTLRVLARVKFDLPQTLANNGSDSHAGYRRIMTRLFNAPAVAAAVPMVEKVVAEALDDVERRLAADGVCDLATTLARDVPFRVMLRLLDLQSAVDVGIDTLSRWSDASLELFWGRPRGEREVALAREAAAFYAWLTALVSKPAPEPGTLLGALAAHRLPDGERLGLNQKAAVVYFMIIAGQMTTTQMLGTMCLRALREPGLWQRFAAEPAAVAPWTEEVLRRDPPITTWRRITGRPVTVSGVELPAGAPLLLMLASTGSDPEVFDDPGQLCPYRSNVRRHLSFGLGRHRCSGAELARMEADVVMRMTTARLPRLRLSARTAPEMLALLSFRAPLQVLVERG
ncbi:cytochrome P450 [Streptomyces sp. NPDC048257]|uniref:cytochrome P450 n=1 Tax=Streptomyces sp. NPDC048257 TaxID=3365526 RepID=UPI0037199631